jgi:hypothetical protein
MPVNPDMEAAGSRKRLHGRKFILTYEPPCILIFHFLSKSISRKAAKDLDMHDGFRIQQRNGVAGPTNKSIVPNMF